MLDVRIRREINEISGQICRIVVQIPRIKFSFLPTLLLVSSRRKFEIPCDSARRAKGYGNRATTREEREWREVRGN